MGRKFTLPQPFSRKLRRMITPLTPKLATAPRARASISCGRKWSISPKNAPKAKIIPRTFSHAGDREDAVCVPSCSRSCNRTAASPTAPITTTASGLKNAPAVGKQHDEGQGSAKQAGSNHRPTTGMKCWGMFTLASRVQSHCRQSAPRCKHELRGRGAYLMNGLVPHPEGVVEKDG